MMISLRTVCVFVLMAATASFAAEQGEQVAILKKETAGCKRYNDFVELEALRIEKLSVGTRHAETETAKELRAKEYAELKKRRAWILKAACESLKPGGKYLIVTSDAVSGPYEVKNIATGVTYYLPEYYMDAFEIK